MARVTPTVERTPLYAMMRFDGRKLLLPQSEVWALEPAVDVDTTTRSPHGVGWISHQGDWWPVYCLTRDLAVLAELPEARRICALLKKREGYLGMVCDDLITVQGESLQFYPVPVCMRSSSSPIQNLAILGKDVGLVSTTAHLGAFIGDGLAHDGS